VLAAIQGRFSRDPERPDEIRLPFGFRFCLGLWRGVTGSCYGVAKIGQGKPVRNSLGNESSLIEAALSKPPGVQRDSHYRTRLCASAISSFIASPISAPIQSNAASILSNAGVINLHYASEFLTEPGADV